MQSAAKEVDTTLSEQEKSEIRASYKNAIDPRQQVKILTQLYLVSREEILDVLGDVYKRQISHSPRHFRGCNILWLFLPREIYRCRH